MVEGVSDTPIPSLYKNKLLSQNELLGAADFETILSVIPGLDFPK